MEHRSIRFSLSGPAAAGERLWISPQAYDAASCDGLHGRLWGVAQRVMGVSLGSFASVRSTCFRQTIVIPGVVMNETSGMLPNPADMGKPWARADLFFLKDSLERGMSLAEIAGFLRRTADEVREKAKSLNG
jgi:hypothetical protein